MFRGLLDLDGGAGLLELALELLGLVLVDALLDGLGGLVDERLGLLEAQARRRADDLDDLDLLVAGPGEDDVEGRLLLGGLGAGAAVAGSGGGSRGDGRGGHAELLLEGLDALGQLEHGDRLQLVDPLLGVGHVPSSPWFYSDAGASSVAAVVSSEASTTSSVAASAAEASAGGASPPTRPCSAICASWRPRPEMRLLMPAARPVSG